MNIFLEQGAPATPERWDEQRSAMGTIRWFLLIAVAALMAHGLCMYAIDPRGDFRTGIFPVAVLDSRTEKMRLFAAYNAESPIQGLVLGSSRAMKLSPREFTRATGLRFFNFAVDNARTEDYLAIYRWVRSHRGSPRALVIGLDVEALDAVDALDNRLQRNYELRRSLAEDSSSRLSIELGIYKSIFTMNYIRDARKSVWEALRPSAAPLSGFEADGYLRYFQWESERSRAVSVFRAHLDKCLSQYLGRFQEMQTLSSLRKRRLEATIREAQADGARVVVWITPLHALTTRFLEEQTRYGQVLSMTRAYLGELKERLAISVHDFSDPVHYDDSLGGWYDCAHTDEEGSDRIAHVIAGDLNGL